MTTNTPNRYNPGNFQLHTIANPTEVHNISDGHPVWKVTMPQNHVVIVKAERVGNGKSRDETLVSATFGVHLMAAVTPGMEAVKLSQNELRAMWDIDQSHLKPQANDHGARAKAHITHELKDDLTHNVVFKMPFVPDLLKLDDAVKEHKTAEFAQHLAADDYAATVELGKILAVDLFIGNDDRFAENGDLVNSGNVLLHKDGQNKWHAIGLDHFSYYGQHSNLSTPAGQGWGGAKLNTPNQMLNFAGKIMTALNATGNGKPALGLQAKFQEKLAQGLAQGAAMIRTTVQHSEPSTIPDGVKTRFQALHWDLKPPTTNNNNNNNNNPVQIVNQVMGGNHPPQPNNNNNTGGRQSPNLQQSGGRQSPNLQQSGGRQSPNLQQSGGRQSPNQPQPSQTNPIRRSSNNK